jgi:hypothetical protein
VDTGLFVRHFFSLVFYNSSADTCLSQCGLSNAQNVDNQDLELLSELTHVGCTGSCLMVIM